MSPQSPDPDAEDEVRQQAALWFARMRGGEAESHRAAFETWVADPEHRSVYDRMAVRWQQGGLIGHTESGRAFDGLPDRRAGLRGRGIYALAACLVAAIVVGLAAWAWRASPGTSGPGAQLAATAISSPVGMRRVRLADGSIVTLDTDTSIAVRFAGGERRIELARGRARFEVAHDAARPFVVAAGGDEVVALGTVFDVSLVSGRPRVSLLRGSVEVRHSRSTGGAPGRRIARLVPGQAIDLEGEAPAPQPAPSAEEAWTSGMLAFDNAPLAQVLEAANRYSAQKLSFEGADVGALMVTGTFHADRPDEMAATLAAAFGLAVEHRDGTLVLRRRVKPRG